jgi:hypothetical protein
MHTWTHDRGLSYNFIGPWAVGNGLTTLKSRWWRFSSFSIATEYTRTLSLPTCKKTEGLSQANLWAVPKILLTWIFSFFCVRNSLLIFVQLFYVQSVYFFFNVRHKFHTHRKQQATLYFSLSRYLRPWITKCRHHIYNLLVSRHSPKILCS